MSDQTRCARCRADYTPLPNQDSGICPGCIQDLNEDDWRTRAKKAEGENTKLRQACKDAKQFLIDTADLRCGQEPVFEIIENLREVIEEVE